jgi:hypothetical protein
VERAKIASLFKGGKDNQNKVQGIRNKAPEQET